MTTFAVDPGPLARAYANNCEYLDSIGAADALWQERLDFCPGNPEARLSVANRLGWLRALDTVESALPRLRTFAATVRDQGYERVVLMGMGGSSLAPEVLRQVVGVAPGFPHFVMVDTVNPAAVRRILGDRARTLYVVASKSGTTIEPMSLAAEARRVSEVAGGWGPHAVAITDPDTHLHREALGERFRDVFINPPDIGGRYSALSLFGMVPAALMGADLDGLVASGRGMERACRHSAAAANAGLALGALMAAATTAGRDKLTLLLPPAFAAFGMWVEQLVAESTGKLGTGVLPVTGEPTTAVYGADRFFVEVTFAGEPPDPATVARARATRAPRISIEVPRAIDLAAEFLRWEVATAITGLFLGVNPFDEPNVQQAKEATRVLLDRYESDGRLSTDPADRTSGTGITLTLTQAARSALGDAPSDAWLSIVAPGDYVAILAFLGPDPRFAEIMHTFRMTVRDRLRVATMVGYGPRYLHSTGQLHKGGPNTGVFILVTAAPKEDVEIPERSFSFGTLELAQGLGDFASLDATGRRAVHVHLPSADPSLLEAVLLSSSRMLVR